LQKEIRMANASEVVTRRQQLVDRFARKLDKYFPETGEMKSWTISELEKSLMDDVTALARDVIELRLEVDAKRVSEVSPRCPDCEAALSSRLTPAHKHTLFGVVRYERTYGHCPACGRAFSPSGLGVRLREGLL